MQDYLNESEISYNESYSISEPTLKEDLNPSKSNIEIEENIKEFPIRCPDCWYIPKIYANFKTKNYCLMCDDNHKNIYMSFEDLIENANKKFSSLLCSQCKSDKDVNYRCNDNNLFFCSKCKNSYKSTNFSEIKDIDIICPKHYKKNKFYDIEINKHLCEECYEEQKEKYNKSEHLIEMEKYINYKDSLDIYYKKSIDNINMWNNTSRIINNWLKKINDKFNEFLNSIRNYCLLQQKIVSFLKTENSYSQYKNNFNIYCNYIAINDEKIDTFIKNINDYLNYKYNKNFDICTMSRFFINMLDDFNQTELNIEAKNNIINKGKGKEMEEKVKNNKEIKQIKEMNLKKYELNSKIKCLIPFEKDNYIILGMDTGEIRICDSKENELKEKFNIKEFDSEINHICEIDKELIIASDINLKTKIIQIKEDFTNYSVIKNINLGEYKKINKIISLPIISYFKNRQYLGIALDKSILIYKSNKMPFYLDPPYLQYHNVVEEFSIVQPSFIHDDEKLSFNLDKKIILKHLPENIIEINDKYLAVSCPESKSLKLFNTQKDFKEELTLPNLIPHFGCFMKVTLSRKELIIGYNGGLNIFEFNNEKKVRNIKWKQNIKFFDFIGFNCIMCLSSNNNDIYIKQYQFKKGFKDINKISEVIVLDKNTITNFVNINNKIYYIDDTNFIHYYE